MSAAIPTMTMNLIQKKKRIGVVKTDNHGLIYAYCLGKADRYEFLQAGGQLYILENEWSPVIPLRDSEITGCWSKTGMKGISPACTEENFARAFNCKIYDTLEEMADPDLFDGILVGNCGGYGEDHLELCMPFIKKGIPIFIDKPFAINATDAAALLNAAREYNCPVFSSSILLYDICNKKLLTKNYGKCSFVVSTFKSPMESRNASVHTLSALLGAVRFSNGDDYKINFIEHIGTEKNEIYRLEFNDGTVGIMNMEGFGTYAFHVQVYAERGISSEYTTEPTLRTGIIDIAAEFLHMIDTRKPPLAYDRIFEFVATIDAGLRSKTEHRAVTLQEIADEAGWIFGE
ncbi:MAG: Gfo/Idh/MocA family oxidoreductase [Oscillospiraceae bacterium]|nr:Gfo/Idh/MocA family oxidoreductase [Oscillospiraceae bacterium]